MSERERNVTRRQFIERTTPWAAAGAAAAVWSTISTAAEVSETRTNEKVLNRVLRVVGISCSPRKGKSTAQAVATCLDAVRAAAPAIETQLIDLGGMDIDCRVAAGVPLPEGRTDDFLALIPQLESPEVRGIIIGTPVYFGNMSGLCKSLLDRFHVFHKEKKLAGKVAGVIACGAGRNGGQELTLRCVHTALMSQQMIIVGDAPPTSHWGGTVWTGAGDTIAADEFGISTVRNLGKRVAEMVLLLAGAMG